MSSSDQDKEKKQIESALQESEAGYRNLVNNHLVGVYKTNLQGELLFANEAMVRICEAESFEELKSSNVLETYKDPQQREVLIKKLKQNGWLNTFEIGLISKTKKPKHVLVSAVLNGEVISGMMMDITERKHAEEELKTKGQLLDAATDAIIVHDFEGNILYVNEVAYKTRGYTKDELLGMNLRQLLIPEHAKLIKTRIAELKKRGILTFESSLFHKDKSTMSIEVHERLIEWQDKKVVLSVARSITQRKQREEELKKSQLRYMDLYEHAPDMHISVDAKTAKILLCNKTLAKETGYTKKEIIGRSIFDMYTPASAKYAQTNLFPLFKKTGSLKGKELQLRRKDGTTIDVSLNTSAVRDPQGNIIYSRSVWRDISERKQAEKKMRESNEKFSLIFENAKDAIFWANPTTGLIINCNKSAQVLLEKEKEEIIGQPQTMLHPPQKAEYYKSMFKKHIDKKESFENEAEVITKSGRIKPVHITASVTTVGDNLITQGIFRDIAERKRMEQSLQESEKRYRTVVETLHEGLTIVDTHENIIYVNSSACQIFGYPEKEFAKLNLRDLTTPEGWQRVLQGTKKRKEGTSSQYELKMKCQDGNFKDILVSVTPWADEKGNYTRSIGLMMDITERKQAEEEREKLLRIFEVSKEALHVDAPDTTIIYANKALYDLFGYKPGELIGKPVSILNVEAISKETIKQVLEAIAEKGFWEGEVRNKKKDGTEFISYATVTGHKDKDGKTTNYISTQHDITERKQMEMALQKAKDDLEIRVEERTAELKKVIDQLKSEVLQRKQAEIELGRTQTQLFQSQKMEALGTLAGGVAHDFNNLLTIIRGYTDLALLKTGKDNPLYHQLKQTQQACLRAVDLTHQVLLFSAKEPMEFNPLNLNKTVDDLLEMLNRLLGEKAAIQVYTEPDLWTIRADKGNIDQVIINLAINARDAMPDGGKITIRTENVTLDKESCKMIPESRAGKFVCLSMTDTGVGIDKKTMHHIFEPFFTTKGPGQGSGLGLSVAYGIIREHEGWINVYSEPGQGSIFKVYLPAVPVKIEEKPEEPVTLELVQGKNERILVVEDEEEVRNFVTSSLRENGYVVREASNAQEALEIFEKEKGNFNLLFSDVVLPGQNGFELATQLTQRQPGLLVLLGSGYADDKSRWPMLREQGILFILKPYDIIKLFQTIRQILEPAK